MAGGFGEDERTPVTVRVYRPSWLKRAITRRRAAYALGGLAIAVLLAAIPIARITGAWREEAITLADQHRLLAVAHPGWSFPARVVSAPVPENASRELKLATATALDYRAHCPPGPGEFCAKTREVVPREGKTLEPVTLGWVIGPDAELREHLPLEKTPQHLIDAILAAEDRDFREHNGVNFSAMVRALVSNVKEGGYTQGASTLSMQVVRNWNQQKKRTLSRKLREAVMAMAVDAHLGKDGVLQAYLDTPYLGQRGGLSICGFQAAAQHYFGKDAIALDLAEAATLAAILPSPGRFGPDRAPALARQKRDRVLEAMRSMGYDVDAALASPIHTVPPGQLEERFPAYLSLVRAELEAGLPMNVVQGAGLEVTAAIDLYMQSETEKLLAEKTRYLATLVPKQNADPLQSAGIVLDVDSGRVRAIYGGDQATSTDFNRATQSLRQGGSAFKPVLYALALSLLKADGQPRFTAASTEPNMPRVFKTPQGDWRPRNVAGEYSETASLAQGMAWSMNLVTAALLEDVGGPQALLNFAAKAGLDVTHFPQEMGVGLGQGEVAPVAMAELAAMIAGGGRRVRAKAVLSAKDFRGAERWPKGQDATEVMTPEAAAVTRELMRGVVDFGTGGAARGAGGAGYSGPMIGKTGTTDEEKDLWFMGATPRYASVVWMGYDRPARIGASASDFAAPLWGWWMNKLTRPDGPPPAFSAEPKLVRRAICSLTGKLAGPGCHGIPASFLPGTQPKVSCAGDHAPDPIAEMLAGAREVNGKAVHESLWKKLARERAENLSGTP